MKVISSWAFVVVVVVAVVHACGDPSSAAPLTYAAADVPILTAS